MKTRRVAAVIAIVGTLYLVIVSWLSSWWHVPASVDSARRGLAEGAAFGGSAFSILWGISGVLGAIIVALGAAVCAKIGALRLLLFAAGSSLLMLWLVLWSASSHNSVVYGVGGSLILLFFLIACFDWVGTRSRLEGPLGTASDLRLAANVCFFITAWGLCGLLGAPTFLLRPELTEMHKAASAGSNLAVKILVSLVLGMGLTAIAQRIERHERSAATTLYGDLIATRNSGASTGDSPKLHPVA